MLHRMKIDPKDAFTIARYARVFRRMLHDYLGEPVEDPITGRRHTARPERVKSYLPALKAFAAAADRTTHGLANWAQVMASMGEDLDPGYATMRHLKLIDRQETDLQGYWRITPFGRKVLEAAPGTVVRGLPHTVWIFNNEVVEVSAGYYRAPGGPRRFRETVARTLRGTTARRLRKATT